MVPVVLFHAGVAGFSGGYVGVDIFFVISGYLITGILLREMETGRYSIAEFYQRRIRRIFPALFAVLAVTTLAAAIVLMPSEMRIYARTLAATALFGSNLYFTLTADYFAPDAEVNPLLHTWSLAVEEQYYIVFPVLLWAVWRWGLRKYLALGLIVLCVLSLIAAQVVLARYPTVAFYSLPTRAWELGIGALLACYGGGGASRPVREVAGWVGVAMIVATVVFYTKDTPFPGVAAIPPCLGAALLIWAGRDGSGASSLLSIAPMRRIGLLSYSWYLWHWPLLVLPAVYLDRHLRPAEAAVAVVVSLGAAWLSRRFVEEPFLRKKHGASAPVLWAGGVALAGGVMVSAALWSGASWRLPAEAARLDAYAAMPKSSACRYGEGCTSPGVVLLGDSHAGHYARAFNEGRVQLAMSTGCAPLSGLPSIGEHMTRCAEWTDTMLAKVAGDAKVETVILSGRWSRFFLSRKDSEWLPLGDQPEAALKAGVAKSVERLQRAGKRVVVIGPSPTVAVPLPSCLARVAAYGREGQACQFNPASLPGAAAGGAVKRGAGKAIYIDPAQALCPDGTCHPTIDGAPLLWDTDHLSDPASALVWRDVERELEK